MDVRAVEVTDSNIGDAPMLPALLSRVSGDEPIASVTADGAYDGRTRRDVIACEAPRRSSTRRNAKPWKKDSPGARGRNDDLRAIRRFDRTL